MNRKLLFAAMFATITGVACSGDTDVSEAFSELDKDNDGFITQNDALVMPSLSSTFTELDQDRDGRLSEAEFSKFEMYENAAPDVSPERGIDRGMQQAPGVEPSGGAVSPGPGSDSYQ